MLLCLQGSLEKVNLITFKNKYQDIQISLCLTPWCSQDHPLCRAWYGPLAEHHAVAFFWKEIEKLQIEKR